MYCNLSKLRFFFLFIIAYAMVIALLETHLIIINQIPYITLLGIIIPSTLIILPLESALIVIVTTLIFLCTSTKSKILYAILLASGFYADYYLNVIIRKQDPNIFLSLGLVLISSAIVGIIMPAIIRKILIR